MVTDVKKINLIEFRLQLEKFLIILILHVAAAMSLTHAVFFFLNFFIA